MNVEMIMALADINLMNATSRVYLHRDKLQALGYIKQVRTKTGGQGLVATPEGKVVQEMYLQKEGKA